MPLPTPQVPSRVRELAVKGVQCAGQGLFHTGEFAVVDVAPFLIQGGAALAVGAGSLTLVTGTLLAGGGMAVAGTVMRDRDRPVDEVTYEMEDAAHQAAMAPRPALRDYEITNKQSTMPGRRWRLPSATSIVSNVLPAVMPYPYDRSGG